MKEPTLEEAKKVIGKFPKQCDYANDYKVNDDFVYFGVARIMEFRVNYWNKCKQLVENEK